MRKTFFIYLQKNTGFRYNFLKNSENVDNNWSHDNWMNGELPGSDNVVCIKANCQVDIDVEVGFIYVLNINDVLTVPQGNSLVTTYGVGTLQASQLVVEDGASLYNPISNAYGTIKKNVASYSGSTGWYTLSTPIHSGTPTSFFSSGTYDLYYYDEPTHYWRNKKKTSNNFTKLQPVQGCLYAHSTAQTLSFEGEINASNKEFEVPVTHDGGPLAGYTLVGNPYSHNLNISDVKVNGTSLTSYYKIINGSNLVAYTGNDPIGSCEGFMVVAPSEGTLTFTHSRQRSEEPMLRLILSQGGTPETEALEEDRAYLRMEHGEELEKMSLPGSQSLLYFKQGEGSYAVANGESQGDAAQLCLEVYKSGNYVIEASLLNASFDYLHLIDVQTGNDIDLLATPRYSFEALPSDNAGRFALAFSPDAVLPEREAQGNMSRGFQIPSHGSSADKNAYLAEYVTITATASPTAGGTVTGGGSYDMGTACTLTATANTGYTFVNWTKNGNEVSTSATYTFTVTEAGAYVANFSLNTYQITATSNPAIGGTVTGAGNYEYGSTATLTATANTGYTFTRWTKNGTQVSTEATYSFTVTEAASYIAVFTPISYSITASAEPAAGGTVTGAGNYNYGSTATLTAAANTGYTFARWTKNGTQVSTNPTYSFTVTGTASYIAEFTSVGYSITVSSSPAAGGTVTGAGSYNYGSTVTLTATANTGYTFTRWTKNGTQVSTNPTYSFTVTETASYIAEFALISYSITATAEPAAGGTVTGAGNYEYGSAATLTATANIGYTFTRWTKNGTEVSTDAVYLFTVTETASYIAEFTSNSYPIIVSASPTAGGTVTGAGNYDYGTTATLTATANAGYIFVNWTKDGEVISNNATHSFIVTEAGNFEAVFRSISEAYFTIESLVDNNTININIPSGITAEQLTSVSYSTDMSNWTTVTNDNNSHSISVWLEEGDKLYMKGLGRQFYFFNEDNWSTSYVQINAIGDYSVSGNIMSLLYGDGFASQTAFPIGSSSNFSCLFKNSSTIVSADDLILPATTLTSRCYWSLFEGCTSLTEVPALPATTLADYCYGYMFWGCTSLTEAPALPATTLAEYCYGGMFWECTSLTEAPMLPATTLAVVCYAGMFEDCISLTEAPSLPATTLVKGCYSGMFQGCTSLTGAPSLPATTMEEICYSGMFKGCTSLTEAPALSATTLANYCCREMFAGCTSLTGAPALSATALAKGCYHKMFEGCTSLTDAPTLPATTMIGGDNDGDGCYSAMFKGCTLLTGAPSLPATTLAEGCYSEMFYGCTSLTETPILSATTLTQGCYGWMFSGCSSLNEVTCLATDISASYSTQDWLNGVATTGTFHKNSEMNDWPLNSSSGIPQGWTIQNVYNVTATANPVLGGTVTGAGSYYHGSSCTLTTAPNEGYTFVNWTENGEAVSASATYSFTVTANRDLTANFEASGITQTASLPTGWSWWSTYIEMEGNNGLQQLEESLGHNGLMIKTQVPYVQNYYPSIGSDYWFGSLTNVGLTNETSYQINVSNSCEAVVSGAEADAADHPITIQSGWNWIGYPVTTQQSLTAALSGYTPAANDLIKGQSTSATYYANYGWFPTSFVLTPGQGYMYYSTATGNKTLTYAESRGEYTLEAEPQRVWTNDVHTHAGNLTVTATITIDGEEQQGDEHELGAFVEGECRGSAVLRYFEPTDRWYAMLTVTGEEGEDIRFAIIDRRKGTVNAKTADRLTYSENAIVGCLDNPYEVRFADASTLRIYPNPTEPNTGYTLDIPMDETIADVVVYDMQGNVVTHETGTQTRTRMQGIAVSGIYMVKAVCRSGKVYEGRLVVR